MYLLYEILNKFMVSITEPVGFCAFNNVAIRNFDYKEFPCFEEHWTASIHRMQAMEHTNFTLGATHFILMESCCVDN